MSANNNDMIPGPTPDSTTDDIKIALAIYVLYLVSLLIPFIPAIIGVIIAYEYRKNAPAWLATHYRFQIRTFWLWLLYGFISLLLTMIIIGFLLIVLLLIWVIVRCIKGIRKLDRNEAYPDPATWLF